MVSVNNVYIANQLQTTVAQGMGGVKSVNSKEENSETPDYVQECGLWIHTHSPKTKCFFAGDISGPGFKELLYSQLS